MSVLTLFEAFLLTVFFVVFYLKN